jgi:ribonuclease BN (tRNA processing enzyme)
MTAVPGPLRLTVLGCSTALPHPDAPSAGFLVEWDKAAVLLDAGHGVADRLARVADPRRLSGVIVSHMHADHFLDLVDVRYLFPWAGGGTSRLPVHLPPGGRRRLDDLASAISERPGFFDAAYAVEEYDPDLTLGIGPLVIRFAPGRHYVPAWAISVVAPDGARVVYTGDTGPSDTITDFARGADLLLVEATLRDAADDDAERGHLTGPEAIAMARAAEVAAARLIHYAPDRRAELDSLCAAAGPWITTAASGQCLTVASQRGDGRAAAIESRVAVGGEPGA